MISANLISRATELAKINGPLPGHLDIANNAGQKIATILKANKDIILLGTLLMDCAIGTAIKEKRLSDHIQMSHDIAKQLLDQDEDITTDEKQNVLSCILEHHGAKNFYSLESEIVCNSDCYRFASVPGFYCAMTQFEEISGFNMTDLFKSKFIEKTNAITLDFVKDDLNEQISTIRSFVSYI